MGILKYVTFLLITIQMDSFIGLIGNIYKKFFDDKEREYPCVRMTDIPDITLISSTTVSSTGTFNQKNDICKDESSTPEKIYSNNILNNLKSNCDNNTNTDQDTETNNKVKIKDVFDQNENKLVKLNIMIPNVNQMDIVDDLSKIQSPIAERNSKELVFTQLKQEGATEPKTPNVISANVNNKQKQIRPIMGKNALLKKANIDTADSQIVHNIVLDKYNPVLNHYVNRMYQRRISRNSTSEDDCHYSDTVFSSPPDYSPISISSVSSMTADEQRGFVFPCIQRNNFSPTEENVFSHRGSMKNVFSFITSTDDLNAETTFEDAKDISLSSTGIAETSFSDYDPEKFLKNALGDLSESAIRKDTSEKHFKKSCHKKSSSIGSNDISYILSKASSFYSSVKEKIKKKRPHLNSTSSCKSFSEDHHKCMSNENFHLEDLKKELAVQNEIMFQISKALIYCRTSKEFNYGPEHIEAEKILLITLITKETLISEINSIEFNSYQHAIDPRCTGEIQISKITFFPSENNNDDVNDKSQSSRIYFLVVVTCGKKVLASSVIEQDEKHCIHVDKCFDFKDLSADFEICICVYSMAVQDKNHLNQEHLKCPSPKTIFHLNKPSRRYKVVNDVPYIKPSAFSLQGKRYIRAAELPKANQNEPTSLNLHDVPIYSKIAPTFESNISKTINLKVKLAGFLTVGIEHDNACTLWNRRWCVLEGSQIQYWNYPSEESTPPLSCINLSYCIVQQIMLADRSACARPRTLLLPVKLDGHIRKYLFSADNNSEMEMWENEMNFVLRCLTIWNCMKFDLA